MSALLQLPAHVYYADVSGGGAAGAGARGAGALMKHGLASGRAAPLVQLPVGDGGNALSCISVSHSAAQGLWLLGFDAGAVSGEGEGGMRWSWAVMGEEAFSGGAGVVAGASVLNMKPGERHMCDTSPDV